MPCYDPVLARGCLSLVVRVVATESYVVHIEIACVAWTEESVLRGPPRQSDHNCQQESRCDDAQRAERVDRFRSIRDERRRALTRVQHQSRAQKTMKSDRQLYGHHIRREFYQCMGEADKEVAPQEHKIEELSAA